CSRSALLSFPTRRSSDLDLVHYIAPPFSEVPRFLNGLSTFETVTRGAEPLARAAVIAFGFVYIHPMRDGNGRLHRFLINDSLIRDRKSTRLNSSHVSISY